MSDLPDYTAYITQNIELPAEEQGPVIPRPKGGVLAKGSITTTSEYQTVAEYTPTAGKTFQLTKILVSPEQDTWVSYWWNGIRISAEILLTGKIPFTDWFPWDYYPMQGDGSKKFEVKAKAYTTEGYCGVEIVGEEVE